MAESKQKVEVRVIVPYLDKQLKKSMVAGDTFFVSPTRAKQLFEKGLVKIKG